MARLGAPRVHEQDRQIARDAEPPETGLTELVSSGRVALRPQRSVGKEHPRRQPLEQQRVVARDREVVQGALDVHEREREGAHGGAWVAVLLRQSLCRFAIARHARREREADSGSRGEADALAQAEDGIEHDSGGGREAAAVDRGRRPRSRGRVREISRDRFPIRSVPASGLRGSARAAPREQDRRDLSAAGGRATPNWPGGTPFRRTACQRRGAPGRRPAAASAIST